MGFMQAFIIGMVIGVLFGFLFHVTYIRLRFKKYNDPVGVLKIETTDPDGPYLFLELNREINDVINQKTVNLTVDINTEYTHE